MLERSERRAWWVAIAGLVLGLIGIAAVFVQGPLRRVVEIPIVVDRVTGEATVQQRLSVETIPPMEALDKHNLASFVRAREGYSWMFLQRDFDQVARMAVPAGSVGIGGEQTGIYPAASPGGWQLIGRTDAALFMPQRNPPALLSPGDRVRFVASKVRA